MKYYIYLTPSNYEYYAKECFSSGWNNFTLSKTEGKYHEEGYFCGAASYYGFADCEVIGESKNKYSFYDDYDEVVCECEYLIERVNNEIKDVEDGCAWRNDHNLKPYSFEAENDNEAFEYFKKFCFENKDNKDY